MRAYRTFNNFRTGTNPKAWLFTIMHSILTNRWRRAARSAEVPLDDDFEGHLPGRIGPARIEQDLIGKLDASTGFTAGSPPLESSFVEQPGSFA